MTLAIMPVWDGVYYMSMYPQNAEYLMNCNSYTANFYQVDLAAHTQDNPFTLFGFISSDAGTYISFIPDMNEAAQYDFEFYLEDTNIPYLFEAWCSAGIEYLRITPYPNGYDGNPGNSFVVEAYHEEAY